MHRLDKAGYAVKKASEDLTKAAKDAREAKEDSQVRLDFDRPLWSWFLGRLRCPCH